MQSKDILALGLGLESPWELVDQELATEVEPHELHLRVSASRGSLFPCPECGQWCKARDFKEMTWRHLNFFQHHAYITADVSCSPSLRASFPPAVPSPGSPFPPPGRPGRR